MAFFSLLPLSFLTQACIHSMIIFFLCFFYFSFFFFLLLFCSCFAYPLAFYWLHLLKCCYELLTNSSQLIHTTCWPLSVPLLILMKIDLKRKMSIPKAAISQYHNPFLSLFLSVLFHFVLFLFVVFFLF